MIALSRRSFLALWVIQTAVLLYPGWGQTPLSLRNRIPSADPRRYRAINDGKDWRTPYLVIRAEAIEVLGETRRGRLITVDSVPAVLEGLPDSAWPYGLVVAVQDSAIVSSEKDRPREVPDNPADTKLDVSGNLQRWRLLCHFAPAPERTAKSHVGASVSIKVEPKPNENGMVHPE